MDGSPERRKYLIVAAHPDDETIGAAIWMNRHGSDIVSIVHITDGSPEDEKDARTAGFTSGAAYAHARRHELLAAVALAGVPCERCFEFGIPDQKAHLTLPAIIEQLTQLLHDFQFHGVLCPAYEGGHPDHDAAALAIAMARSRLHANFAIREFPLYHAASDGSMRIGEFLPFAGCSAKVIYPSREELELKTRMLAMFKTQARVLQSFPAREERFRDQPDYDFLKPPHSGPLLYEHWGWLTGTEWRRYAKQVFTR